MNLLITSCGRRKNIVEWFKSALNKVNKKLYVTDRDQYAPALYFADDHFILDDTSFSSKWAYLNALVDKCKAYDISHIISLHDEQILLFSKYAEHLKLKGITLIASDYKLIKNCYDKSKYKKFPINQVPTVVLKNRFGSASQGLVRQPYIEGKEYNVQCYFDLISGELVDIFMQEKILMRAGETERSVSCWNRTVIDEVYKLIEVKGFRGAIDIDVIVGDKPYIIDINPRFGGGYPLAHRCSCNFVDNIVNNMQGDITSNICGTKYPYGVVMMKYNGLYFKEEI